MICFIIWTWNGSSVDWSSSLYNNPYIYSVQVLEESEQLGKQLESCRVFSRCYARSPNPKESILPVYIHTSRLNQLHLFRLLPSTRPFHSRLSRTNISLHFVTNRSFRIEIPFRNCWPKTGRFLVLIFRKNPVITLLVTISVISWKSKSITESFSHFSIQAPVARILANQSWITSVPLVASPRDTTL